MNEQLLEQFESFNEFAKTIDDVTWITPISAGKWTVKEVISHLWNWDVYTLEVMLPQMKDQVEIPEFADHDTYNLIAVEKAKEFYDREAMIRTFIETRTYLIDQFRILDNPEMKFWIGNDKIPYSLDRYIEIFVHHDDHHKRQIEKLCEA